MVDHPRIRGEHVRVCVPHGSIDGSSPHTRGAPGPHKNSLSKFRIIPAYAGSTIARSISPIFPQDHPRIRGEHDRAVETLEGVGGSSPHTRGAPPAVAMPAAPERIIPAYAGSTGATQEFAEQVQDHPRIRGEHGEPKALSGHFQGIIPAYAGSTTRASKARRQPADHPRIRGEHRTVRTELDCTAGSSPHTRGALEIHPIASLGFGIIPAYAGSTHHSPQFDPAHGDHPRIRGEHPSGDRDIYNRPRIIPAYAGSTCSRATPSTTPADHPRIRGEHINTDARNAQTEGSSPHTRGARPVHDAGAGRPGIIPAYAGSTSWRLTDAMVEGDHPRIRGEHRPCE